MANKHDLKIVQSPIVAAGDVVNILGAVPKGKTRFICFIKMGQSISGPVAIIDGEAAISAATIVDVIDIAAGGTLAFPDKVDVDNPLFSISEERFLNIQPDGTAVGEVTFVYFDE